MIPRLQPCIFAKNQQRTFGKSSHISADLLFMRKVLSHNAYAIDIAYLPEVPMLQGKPKGMLYSKSRLAAYFNFSIDRSLYR